MRRPTLCALLLLLPLVQAEPWTDAAGDTALMAGAGGSVPLGPAALAFPDSDLVGLEILERPEAFEFRVQVAGLSEPQTAGSPVGAIIVFVTHDDAEYQVRIDRTVRGNNTQAPWTRAQLFRYDEGLLRFVPNEKVPVAVDGSGLFTAIVPRTSLLDHNGTAPFPGRQLTGIHAESYGAWVPEAGSAIFDRLAEAGAGHVLPIQLGLPQTGNARLGSLEPTRMSNGAATTYVYLMKAGNEGGTSRQYTFEVQGAPAHWTVDLPTPVVEIPPGTTVDVPVIVHAEFFHDHGNLDAAIVEMAAVDDPGSRAEVEIGVRYPAIAQPAGHHPGLYLHSRDLVGENPVALALGTAYGAAYGVEASAQAYVNTAEQEDGDAGIPVRPFRAIPGSLTPPAFLTTWTWNVDLEPGLAIGLDFDLSRTTTIRLPIRTLASLPMASVSGQVLRLDPVRDPSNILEVATRNETVLATIEATAPVDLGPNSQATFETTIRPLPDADLVPYERGAAFRIRLNLTAFRPEPPLGPSQSPELMPGGSLTLPLFDYADPINVAIMAQDAFQVDIAGPVQRPVNPGRTAVFLANLTNSLPDLQGFDLQVSGSNSKWARVLGSLHVQASPGETRQVAVAVTVPPDAVDSQRADLILKVTRSAAPDEKTLTRLVAVVDSSIDIEDQAAFAASLEQRDGRGASAIAWPFVAVLLLALPWAAMRRR